MKSNHPKQDETRTVLFDKRAMYSHYHMGEWSFNTEEEEILWIIYKAILGDKHEWKLKGTRRELEEMLKKELGPYYIDNFVVRFVNDGTAQYL